MKNTSTFFKLFAHNIPVKGKDKGAIYDLQNQQNVRNCGDLLIL